MPDRLSLPKDGIRVLLLEGVADSAVALLAAAGYLNVTRAPKALDGPPLAEALAGVHVLGIRSRTQVTARALAAADRLITVGCFCIGTNQVALEAARDRGIPVFNAPFSNTRSVAELVIGEIVMLLRGVPARSRAAHEGGWDKSAEGSFEVRGRHARASSATATSAASSRCLAEAFGMRVIYDDHTGKLPHGNARPVATLGELLAEAEVGQPARAGDARRPSA
jgi:D-3-phosphoglycerate dehydrogenase